MLALSCATNLAGDVFAAGEVEEASRMDTENLERYRAALGADHPATKGTQKWERANCDMDPMPL